MDTRNSSVAVCIPTYKRAHLLSLLLQDLLQQTLLPDHFVVVDGDPGSGTVQKMLTSPMHHSLPITYLPSNHSLVSYQRYLCWRVAADLEVDILIYFDDDQRIYQRDVLEWLTRPFVDDNVVGVGCFSRVPESGHDPAMNHLMAKRQTHWLVQRLGSRTALDLEPGQLTPVGHRVGLIDNGQDYVNTEWLHGRVMAYRMSAISAETFSDDLFALDQIRVGALGEDTFLSRRIGTQGKLLYTFRALVEHPNADTPKAFPYEAHQYAYAATYSRRFQNDYYRVYDPPTISDRWALVKSYAGNVLLAWMRALSKPNKTNLALARGTTLGALHGLTRPPTAKRLTPHIDWWGDAEKALSKAEQLRP